MNDLITYPYTDRKDTDTKDRKDTDTKDTESLAETSRVNKIHDRFLKDHFNATLENATLEIHRQLFPNSIEDLRKISLQEMQEEIQEINEIDIQEINEIDIQEINEEKVNKKVSRWPHKLTDDLGEKEDIEGYEGDIEDNEDEEDIEDDEEKVKEKKEEKAKKEKNILIFIQEDPPMW
ncbi:hypothetical protein HPP92_028418 [Vanilla planifolia]|uniref:Uncharacterized protein n=1 Tax=Vanilla planifolia TaxID=51239 RepID=A0A835P7J8_VANPL|nr:hypothetical protein HPP92_028418 [Vanilla planifolia]